MDQFGVVQAWLLNSYNIKVSPEWLSACLEWIAQENGDEMESENVVKQQVFEQWLTSDLAEIGEPSLPVAAMSCNKIELISNYALQIISIVDVGFPLYGQQQKMMGRENVNAEVSADKPFQPAWEPKQSRMLLLTLTDGHSEIKAMEYQPIRSLHSHLPSGTKCILSGTVLCRRGMVLLTEEHIHLLGGEVDTLTEINTPLNVLQQTMQKSREDDGKHAKQEFTGKFITRCPNKKLDFQKKTSMIKTESMGSRFQHPNQMQTISHFKTMSEMKPKISSSGKVKAETIKVEQSGSSYGFESRNQQEAEEWEDDINYSELLERDIEFGDGIEAHQNNIRTTDGNGRNRCNKSSGISNASISGMGCDPNRANITDMGISEILTEKPLSNQEVISIFDDDKDMEFDVFDNSPTSWRPDFLKTSLKKNNCNDQLPCKASPSVNKPSEQIVGKMRAKPKNSSQDANVCSPQIFNQGCDTSVIGNSGDKKFSPSAAMESSNLSLLPNPHTLEKSDAIATEAKKGQDLPKAVIQPFKPVSNTDLVFDDYGHLSDLQSSNSGPIKVKVSILTLIEKLCSNNGSHWSLACRVSDGATSLDVDISNRVLTTLIGFSAEDSIAMRQRFKSEPDVKEVFAEGLSQCQSKLISGRGGCVLELEPASHNPKGERPVIVNFRLLSS
ncbi:hypothetical protein RRG08_036442 [Elysia crispata]|uniref:RecQ-mediated genome instability protein 1 n=1 Tax=Elysia crispata TaxID=231223 RepID=A0AAE0ZKJ9_9GAST|nr:hypothetical protein RRG08_036442 [Elysia crispata]